MNNYTIYNILDQIICNVDPIHDCHPHPQLANLNLKTTMVPHVHTLRHYSNTEGRELEAHSAGRHTRDKKKRKKKENNGGKKTAEVDGVPTCD